ncbi:MFS transporter [Sunxiuqinia sp. A32]|uniref:MFS transporter n=1 Tax=Sunxiuqinia sp. A32 TaxID=3461496 RepID=UPI004045314D
MRLTNYYNIRAEADFLSSEENIRKRYNRLRWSVFLSATVGYGLYYVCRLSLNVIKKPIVDSGFLSESELGIMGSALFVAYAVGKFINGFLADRSNIRLFMALGLFISALINIILGFTSGFVFFAVLWGINGWAQSMGGPPSVIALSRWFGSEERGTYYGLWSSSHNIGESLTFILTAVIVSSIGWRAGFNGAGLIGLIGVLLILLFLKESPNKYGVSEGVGCIENDGAQTNEKDKSVGSYQLEVLRNPAIWILALSSAFMYITRYAVNSWGIFFLQAQKGYSTIEASFIVSVSSVCGILGTVSSGWISDKFFGGKRNIPVLIFGVMNVIGLSLFLFIGKGLLWIDIVSMVIFGLAIGALICFLGGLMAVDLASEKATGAALGVIGMASYLGAAIQDIVSGYVIQNSKQVISNEMLYDFSSVVWFWLGSAILSVLLPLWIWNKKPTH